MDVLLHLARLTDPPQSAKKDNLTLQRLPGAVPDPAVTADVRALVGTALAASDSARAWRHRRLAHRDLALALAASSDPLPGISRVDVESALAAIRAVLNRLEAHYWDSQVAYPDLVTEGGDADSCVYYLRVGMTAEEAKIPSGPFGRA